MHIVIVNKGVIPVSKYGGTERVLWYLGRELSRMGHTITYLVESGSSCPFGKVIFLDNTKSLSAQIPADADIVHFNFNINEAVDKPYIITIHGNSNDSREFDINTVFVSQNHAQRYNSGSYVYNGLDWDDYGKVDLKAERKHFHFLGKAAWRVKNVEGAIKVIAKAKGETLKVLGGHRLNIKMGFRLTLNPNIKFYGMVGGEEKLTVLRASKGLVFPVKWNEPFGLAITESLYFGCPVFGTPYGSLPELVNSEVGFLSDKSSELAKAVKDAGSFSRKRCHEYAVEVFNSKKMAEAYLEKYLTVLNGKTLNKVPPKLKEIQKEKFLPWE